MPNTAETYYRYWGKAKPLISSPATGAPCHLLPFHSLDVAAVGFHLLSPETPRNQAIAKSLDLSPIQLQSLFTFALALHDLGKFARSFQGLANPAPECLVTPDSRMGYHVRHDTLGMLFWKRTILDRLGDASSWHWPIEKEFNRYARRALECLLGAVFGHHGQPVASGNESLDKHALDEDQEAAWAFSLAAADLLRPAWPVDHMNDPAWGERLKRMSWHLAGQAVLADWLGSNQEAFHYQSEPENLTDYWQGKALPRANALLQQLGFSNSLTPTAFEGVEQFFGFTPTPLQLWAQDAVLADSPQLFILEDVTGAGKTEAALSLAHRLLEKKQVQGVYFGLPTMATSNAMYTRIADVYRRWFTDDKTPNLVLAHGARQLNEQFGASIIPPQESDANYGPNEGSASAVCNQWFADSRKKALLADVGVGTVDQVLMGLLPFRHQSLRLIGLANKLLIVDEVHACDDYMLTLLTAVLEAHVQQGGSAVLLTATLPLRMRQQLVAAWQRGLGVQTDSPVNTESFPLVTHVSRAGTVEQPVATRTTVARDVFVVQIFDEETAIASLIEAAQQGQCACWIRNTVDDAISAFERLWEAMPEPEKVHLFHSRFVMADRQIIESAVLDYFGKSSNSENRAGRILVGTQVIEQSLDLDFDVMISDLAPIDLLIQRAGRLHRHCRDAQGNQLGGAEGRAKPVLKILAPSFTETPDRFWIQGFLPGTAAVYSDHGQLWLTLKVLLDQGVISMPEQARLLIESVYAEDAEDNIPDGLLDSHFAQEGERQSQVAMGRFNSLKLEQGYVPSSAINGWQEEVDIGTRLSDEPSVTVTLVRLDPDQNRLLPWIDAAKYSWEMSQLTVRQSLASRLPELPAEFETLREQLLGVKPALKYSRLWLCELSLAAMAYDSKLGLHRAKSVE
jgi:CRISPR-associated endonuclease/helicase Cas3